MNKITKYVIYGERCSGTNFLESAINKNFNLIRSDDYGHKHFFLFEDLEKKDTEDVLFIGIIRNPIYWLNSFSKNYHQVPLVNQKLINLLFNPFYSVNLGTQKLLKNDLNKNTGKMYKNIFELRKVKNDYLMFEIPKKVKNYILINYEDLLYNYENTLEKIKDKFELEVKNDEYKKIKEKIGPSKQNMGHFKEVKIEIPSFLIEKIWSNLNIEQEKKLGYEKGDNNNNFKKKFER